MSPRLAHAAGRSDVGDIMIGGKAADGFQDCARLKHYLETLENGLIQRSSTLHKGRLFV